MLVAIRRDFSFTVKVEPPQGGLFIWFQLPDDMSSRVLLLFVLEMGLHTHPGTTSFRILQRVRGICR